MLNKLGSGPAASRLLSGFSFSRLNLKFYISLFVLVLIILAAANPRVPAATENIRREGVDIMIALDLSKSMLAKDISPNRLDHAKLFLQRLIKELRNDRIGLVFFAGRAYLQMPLSSDHSSAIMFLQNADPSLLPSQGTVLSEALSLSNNAFTSRDRNYKTVILVTDGEDHDPGAMEAVEELTKNGVMLNTIGIGSAQGAAVIEPTTGQPKREVSGQPVLSKLNEELLRQLAGRTQGIYISLNDVDEAINSLKSQLNNIERTAIEDQAFISYKGYFQWFLFLAILLLTIEFLLPAKTFRKR